MHSAAITDLVALALREDLAPEGDLTTTLLAETENKYNQNPVQLCLRSRKQGGIFSGQEFGSEVFRQIDQSVNIEYHLSVGERFGPEASLAILTGAAASLLTGERLFLNLIQRACSIASYTDLFVQAVAHTKTKILDTRKTMPGLRILDKRAVRDGGGQNQRFNLSTGLLVKDNHLALFGGLERVIEKLQAKPSHSLKLQIEVDTLEQAIEAHRLGCRFLLLDNFSLKDLRFCVEELGSDCQLEASGGVTLQTVSAIAETGVHCISIGSLTASPPTIDLGLDAS